MRHLKLLTIALSAIMALTAIIATTAQAAPELKAASYPVEVKAEGKAGELKAGAEKINCEEFSAKGEVTSATLGTVSIVWKGCTTTGGVKCKSEEEGNGLKPTSNGEIWVDLGFHIVLIEPSLFTDMGSTELYWILFLLELVLIKCGTLQIHIFSDGGGVLILTSLKQNVLVKTTESVELEGKEVSGAQEATACEEPAELCTETIQLLSEFVEGKPETSILIQPGTMKFGSEVEATG